MTYHRQPSRPRPPYAAGDVVFGMFLDGNGGGAHGTVEGCAPRAGDTTGRRWDVVALIGGQRITYRLPAQGDYLCPPLHSPTGRPTS